MPSSCNRSQVSLFPHILSLFYACEGLYTIERFDNWCRSPSVLPVLWEKCPRNDTHTQTQFFSLVLCHIHTQSPLPKNIDTHTCFRCFGSLTQSCWGWKGCTCSPQVSSTGETEREWEREKCWHAIADAIHTSHSICLGQYRTQNQTYSQIHVITTRTYKK